MKILVLSLAGIGDTLIATPFLHELRANFPQATIDAFVFWAPAKDLLEGNPHLNHVHQKNLTQAGALNALQFLRELRARRYDVSINVHTLGRIHYRVVARFLGAPWRLSHEYENHGWLDRLLVNRTVPQDYTVHSVENNQRLLALLDGKPLLPSHDYEIYLTPAEETWAADFITRHRLSSRRRLAFHIGSGATKNLRLKRWPFGHWQELTRRLRQSHPDVALLFLGGPAEEEEHALLLKEHHKEHHKDLVLAPTTRNFRQAAALLRHCHSFLSVDTALMHLAAAMKVPNQIVIEAPTLNPTNLPWQNPYRLIRNPVVNGRNLDYYRYDGRPIRGTAEELVACMSSIRVEDVHAAVAESMNS